MCKLALFILETDNPSGRTCISSDNPSVYKVLRFKVFIIMHYFNGSQQKEITIYKKSNIKIALNYINVKSKKPRYIKPVVS